MKKSLIVLLSVISMGAQAFSFRRFCFPIARSPATAEMRTMMAMAMIYMIWSFCHPFG